MKHPSRQVHLVCILFPKSMQSFTGVEIPCKLFSFFTLMKRLIRLFLLLATLPLGAQLKLPSILSDNMCLQKESQVKIWGWDTPGQVIEVQASWSRGRARTTAGPGGNWEVTMTTPGNKGPYRIVIRGSETKEIKNVLLGEVWLCSGQSNMAKPLGWTGRQKPVVNFREEALAADLPEIRLFRLTPTTADEPREDCEGTWEVCSPESVLAFSAAGYFFGNRLHRELEVPVGLVQATWGGTPVEAWTARESMNNPDITRRFAYYEAAFPADSLYYENQLEGFRKGLINSEPVMPESVYFNRRPQKGISCLYDGMIAPLLNFTIAGAIWYQGEANVPDPESYKKQFPNMITTWREAWGIGEFPFYFVQIAPFDYQDRFGSARIAEAQKEALKLPDTGMAPTQDIGVLHDIHPPFKREVGRRLALLALDDHYGKEGVVSKGPVLESVTSADRGLVLTFDPGGGSLFFAGSIKSQKCFYISDDRRVFRPATAVLEGNAIILNHPGIKRPVHARYLWPNDANATLFNSHGLPATSFRTDDWEDAVFVE